MQADPVPSLRDLLSRRDLTPVEARQLEDWLRQHPDSAAAWQADARLSSALRRLAPTPVPSQFTARVLAEVRRDCPRAAPSAALSATFDFDWRALLRRHWIVAGSTALVVLVSGLAWQSQVARRDVEFARQVVPLRVLGEISPAVLEDFDAIRRFAERPAPVDFELLAALQP